LTREYCGEALDELGFTVRGLTFQPDAVLLFIFSSKEAFGDTSEHFIVTGAIDHV
jgi:hypothetical protein